MNPIELVHSVKVFLFKITISYNYIEDYEELSIELFLILSKFSSNPTLKG